jgi:hypothetical protein
MDNLRLSRRQSFAVQIVDEVERSAFIDRLYADGTKH